MTTSSSELLRFREKFQATILDCRRFTAACRASRLQRKAARRLRGLIAIAAQTKEMAIASVAEDEANELLAYEFMLEALANEIEMYVALKRDEPGAAWTHLVNAQTATASAVRSHSVASQLEDGYVQRLEILERLLFPKQLFSSMGFIIEHAECSICGMTYGDCDHIKGRPYLGRMCASIIRKWKLLEVSVVESPADKHCRIITHTDEKGLTKDLLSLETLAPREPNQMHVKLMNDAPLD